MHFFELWSHITFEILLMNHFKGVLPPSFTPFPIRKNILKHPKCFWKKIRACFFALVRCGRDGTENPSFTHMPTSQLVCLLTRHLLSFVQYFLILDNFNHKKKSMKIQPILQESIQENNYISRNSRQNSDPGISLQGYFGQIYGLKRQRL